MYLADAGVQTHAEGKLRMDDLVRYRVDTELDDGLTGDLRASGLGYLPTILSLWQQVKTLISETMRYRKVDEYSEVGGMNALDHLSINVFKASVADQLGRDDASFVLCNSDICYSKSEV